MVFQGVCLQLADDATADGVAGEDDALAVAGDQGVPLGQGLTLCQQAVSTTLRQPVRIIKYLQCNADAVGYVDGTVGVVRTTAALLVEVAAADIGEVDLPGLLIFKSVQTALGAASQSCSHSSLSSSLSALLFQKGASAVVMVGYCTGWPVFIKRFSEGLILPACTGILKSNGEPT